MALLIALQLCFKFKNLNEINLSFIYFSGKQFGIKVAPAELMKNTDYS